MNNSVIIYPLGRDRHVTIDTRRQFGAPCVRKRTPTACLYGPFSAGDSIASIAAWWELTTEEVEDAIRYEVMRRCKHGRQAIKKQSKQE